MSHFTVIVIGGYIDQQLAPYDENMAVAPHFEEEGEFAMTAGKEHAAKRGYDPESLEDIAKALNEEWGEDSEYGVRDGVLGRMTTYNPESKWDWYVIGGRWRGYFPLKDGVEYDPSKLGDPGTFEALDGDREDYSKVRRVDIALKEQIDFEAARSKAEQEGRETFAKWQDIFVKHGKPKSWEEIRDSIEDIEKARETYKDQPAIAASQKTEGLNFWFSCPVTEVGFDEDVYAKKCRSGALVPYAIVKDGKWYGRGDMGWFGMSSNDADEQEWAEKLHALYDELPPNTLITMIDCHI